MDYKVLIIEDDEYNRALYGEVLSGKGCELFFAEDDVSGFAQYEQVKPDLILLDLRFGEREVGLDLFSKIRESRFFGRGHRHQRRQGSRMQKSRP